MVKKILNLKNSTGMHARPASELAKTAMKYNCKIIMKVNDEKYNAKSVLGIMSAGIKNDTDVEIICEGQEEQKAMQEIENLFENNFGE